MKNNVYIADITTILPQTYSLDLVVDTVYPEELAGARVHALARRSISKFQIKQKPVIRTQESFPDRVLATPDYQPIAWGTKIIESFTKKLNVADIGHIGVTYNISSHIDTLPNLACQLALNNNLELESIPEEISSYGCAGGLFSMKTAIDYCSKAEKAAIVYVFDQCSWLCKPIYDTDHPDFISSLKTNLLFGDAGVGLLLIPEKLKQKFNTPLMKVLDIQTDFQLGKEICMNEGRFLVGNDVKDVMPDMVSSKQVKPLLERNKLTVQDIIEWSIHQGGMPVLEKFKEPEILGLTDEQIQVSKESFMDYGNFSSPSCFFVLDRYFKNHKETENNYGAIVSFGAGYYFGSLLYQWQS